MSGTGYSYQYFLLILIVLYSNTLSGQLTIVIDDIPENTPEADTIFISGNFEGWTGGQHTYSLKNLNGKHTITLPKQNRTISFKFTRGTWETVEVNSSGQQIENRIVDYSNPNDSLYFSIENWQDKVVQKSTASANVRIISEDFDMPTLNKQRRIWIYLPDDYDSTSKSYPVLYMHDGQNLFDTKTSYSGEWEVDETLSKIASQIGLKIIVVGIDNGGTERLDEYSPWNIVNYESAAKGDPYVRFIADNLKPYIDTRFRTKKDRLNTGIMGSSMGGLISFYAALEYPETFGKAGIFSPSFEMAPASFDYAEHSDQLSNSKLYFMAGDAESEKMVPYMNKMVDLILASGAPDPSIFSKTVAGGEHHEKLWRNEFGEAVKWLFMDELQD